MVLGCKNGLMFNIMKENGKIIDDREKGNCIILMVIFLKVNGLWIKLMDLELK